jgi:copper chaperone NosL
MKRLWLPAGFLLVGLLAACAAPASDEPQPPEIAYGQDVCEHCGMLIDDARFAAALVMVDAPAHKFDDIAEMVMYQMDHPDQQVRAWFVHNYTTETWARAETAFYVMSAEVDTPMGGGVAAFESEAEAAAFAQSHATTVLNFDEMRAMVHMTLH